MSEKENMQRLAALNQKEKDCEQEKRVSETQTEAVREPNRPQMHWQKKPKTTVANERQKIQFQLLRQRMNLKKALVNLKKAKRREKARLRYQEYRRQRMMELGENVKLHQKGSREKYRLKAQEYHRQRKIEARNKEDQLRQKECQLRQEQRRNRENRLLNREYQRRKAQEQKQEEHEQDQREPPQKMESNREMNGQRKQIHPQKSEKRKRVVNRQEEQEEDQREDPQKMESNREMNGQHKQIHPQKSEKRKRVVNRQGGCREKKQKTEAEIEAVKEQRRHYQREYRRRRRAGVEANLKETLNSASTSTAQPRRRDFGSVRHHAKKCGDDLKVVDCFTFPNTKLFPSQRKMPTSKTKSNNYGSLWERSRYDRMRSYFLNNNLSCELQNPHYVQVPVFLSCHKTVVHSAIEENDRRYNFHVEKDVYSTVTFRSDDGMQVSSCETTSASRIKDVWGHEVDLAWLVKHALFDLT